MCGIISYTGHSQAAPILLDGLSKLEYRGYDSAGLAVRDRENKTKIVKAKGRLRVLAEKTNDGTAMHGTCGIGHTRWATHGEPNDTNAHPHFSEDGNLALVHNGTIENFKVLKDALQQHGVNFHTETDTEVLVQLIEFIKVQNGCSLLDAVREALKQVVGAYAMAVSTAMSLTR